MTQDKSNPDSGTGLPLLRTWGSVYVFVMAFFALVVVLLVLLTRVYW
jgi:hypothetical protein